jgi:hypothetical protein
MVNLAARRPSCRSYSHDHRVGGHDHRVGGHDHCVEGGAVEEMVADPITSVSSYSTTA